MTALGYALSSEEHAPQDLVRNARRAEEAGFSFALISDHYHPWIDRQGHSAFVWSVIGAIAQVTTTLRLGTGVTCPTFRIHPAIIAQAAATAGCLLPGRFFLGVGSGENLNEHILADRWPTAEERLERLEEAVEIIRLLWEGDVQSFHGQYYVVENARVYDLPAELPPIMLAASGPQAAELAGAIGDGLIGVDPDTEVMVKFEAGGGSGKPRYGQFACCWAADEAGAKRTAREWWPTSALGGQLFTELALPAFFEQATKNVTEDQIAAAIVCGPDPEKYLAKIHEYKNAGFDHVYLHQVGPDQEGFFKFAERELIGKV